MAEEEMDPRVPYSRVDRQPLNSLVNGWHRLMFRIEIFAIRIITTLSRSSVRGGGFRQLATNLVK